MILTVNRPRTAKTPLPVGVRHRNAIDLILSLRLLRRMKRAPHRARFAIAVMRVLLVVIAFGASATAATDFTQGVTQLSASQVQVSFTPTTPATFVDLHYLPPPTPPIGQQNVRMTNNAGTWQFTVGRSEERRV